MTGDKKTSVIEIFRRYLEDRGLSFTRQRRIIIEHVSKIRGHFEAKDILEISKMKNVRVSRATIYRTLGQLEKCRLIKKMGLGQGSLYYENIMESKRHGHICCEKCGKIIEFSDSRLKKRIGGILQNNNFNTANHTVQIFSICKNCNKKGLEK